MKKIFLLILFTSAALAVFAQHNSRKTYFPIWSYHQKHANIIGVSAGLWSFPINERNTTTNGIRAEVPGAGILLLLAPRSLTAMNDTELEEAKAQPISEKINGINISALGTACHCNINGITIGGTTQFSNKTNGISISLMGSFVNEHSGLQVGGVFNETYIMNGIQVGWFNSSDRTKGIQIGLRNVSRKTKGIQIGIWNVNEKRKLPLINWNFSVKEADSSSKL